MESLIAGLLKEFEEGKMSRRQLIQSLALAAVAAPVRLRQGRVASRPDEPVLAGRSASADRPGETLPKLEERRQAAVTAQSAAPARETTAAPWKTVWLDHISYAVADYKRSAAFYSDLMGWEIRNDNGKNQATLNINNIGGIIIRNSRQPAANPQPTQPGRPPLTGVINHISWGITPWNTEAVEAELKRRGLNPRPDMQGDNFKSFHVFDPDGWDLQISNRTSDPRR